MQREGVSAVSRNGSKDGRAERWALEGAIFPREDESRHLLAFSDDQYLAHLLVSL